MNAFIAGCSGAIREWWRRKIQLITGRAITAGASTNGHGTLSWSDAGYSSWDVPAIRAKTATGRTTTATATDITASKRKVSIVRIIRVRRRGRAGK